MSTYEGPSDIGQLALPVTDLERSVAFYRDVLGLRFLFRAPPGLAFFQCGDVRLMLSERAPARSAAGMGAVYYRVPDLDLAYRLLRERGATFRRPSPRPHGRAAAG